jgi:hypothetical protein
MSPLNGSEFNEQKGGEAVLPKEMGTSTGGNPSATAAKTVGGNPDKIVGGSYHMKVDHKQMGGKKRKSARKSRKHHRKSGKKSMMKSMKKMMGKMWK